MQIIYTTTRAARDTLMLIRCKVEGNDEGFKKTSLKIADELNKEGRHDAALYIRAQFNETPTFVPMENQ